MLLSIWLLKSYTIINNVKLILYHLMQNTPVVSLSRQVRTYVRYIIVDPIFFGISLDKSIITFPVTMLIWISALMLIRFWINNWHFLFLARTAAQTEMSFLQVRFRCQTPLSHVPLLLHFSSSTLIKANLIESIGDRKSVV